MRFELLEALLRVAITMRDNESEEEISPAEKASVLELLYFLLCHGLAHKHATSCGPAMIYRSQGEKSYTSAGIFHRNRLVDRVLARLVWPTSAFIRRK